jgi:hypothetical protein
MADPRLLGAPAPTPNEVAEALTRALPHGGFRIDPMPQDGPEVLRVLCRCDRALRWVGELPSSILFYWLADHDDDMFLTPEQRERRYSEQLPPLVASTLDALGTQLLSDFAGPMTGLLGPLGIKPEDARPTDG